MSDLEGAGAVLARLDGVADRVANLSVAYRRLDEWWRERQTAYFASPKIARNHPRTVLLKGSNRPLVDTGNLMDATMRNQPFNLTDQGATFGIRKGTPEYKLGILMESSPRGAPERSPVPKLTPPESAKILDGLDEWIKGGD